MNHDITTQPEPAVGKPPLWPTSEPVTEADTTVDTGPVDSDFGTGESPAVAGDQDQPEVDTRPDIDPVTEDDDGTETGFVDEPDSPDENPLTAGGRVDENGVPNTARDI